MNKSEKKFDSVQMMREIREKLSDRYWKHPELLKKEMDAIRKKYGIQPDKAISTWIYHSLICPKRSRVTKDYQKVRVYRAGKPHLSGVFRRSRVTKDDK